MSTATLPRHATDMTVFPGWETQSAAARSEFKSRRRALRLAKLDAVLFAYRILVLGALAFAMVYVCFPGPPLIA